MKKINIKSELQKVIESLKELCNREVWENTFLFSFIAGIVVHLIFLANYIPNHDAICLTTNNFDWLIVQGKWFVTSIASIEGPLNVFFLSGIIGIIAISVAAVVFCIKFRIQNKWRCRLVGLCFVSFPSIATMALYQAMDYFGIAFLMAILAAYFISRKGIGNKFIGIGLLVFSLGAYQAYVGATLVVLILDCLIRTLNGEKFEKILCKGIGYIISVIGSMGFYYLILKILLRLNEMELSSYKGIDNMSQNMRPDVLINSIKVALVHVKEFLINDSLGIYSKEIAILNIFLIGLFVLVEIVLAKKSRIRLKSTNTLMIVFLNALCIPLGVNIIGVLSANTSFYYITVAPFVLLFVLPIALIEQLDVNKSEVRNMASKIVAIMVMSVTLMICFRWSIQNNIVYQKMLLIHQEYDAKLSAFMTRIQDNESYKEGVEIILVGNAPYDFVKPSGVLKQYDDEFITTGYGLGNSEGVLYSESILYSFLKNKYAIKFNIVKYRESLEGLAKEDIDGMEVYPFSGSIKGYENKIVVKLSNNY